MNYEALERGVSKLSFDFSTLDKVKLDSELVVKAFMYLGYTNVTVRVIRQDSQANGLFVVEYELTPSNVEAQLRNITYTNGLTIEIPFDFLFGSYNYAVSNKITFHIQTVNWLTLAVIGKQYSLVRKYLDVKIT